MRTHLFKVQITHLFTKLIKKLIKEDGGLRLQTPNEQSKGGDGGEWFSGQDRWQRAITPVSSSNGGGTVVSGCRRCSVGADGGVGGRAKS